MQFEIQAARALFGDQGALQHLDEAFIKPWRVVVALVTTGNSEVDAHIKREGAVIAHEVHVATMQS
jgi:hypothetical protein